ncbi:MAG TPA: DUF2726 domain-containing protein [Candidatus Anaerobiospirillum stercoravium]|nr:DUF2726 domain-containing protein [Candidatus Anaerobiospirillum stercoravium]
MSALLDYLTGLSAAQLTLHLAGAVLLLLIIVLLVPFGGRRRIDNSWYHELTAKRQAEKEKAEQEKKERAAARRAARSAAKNGKEGARSWLKRDRDFTASLKANEKQNGSVNDKLDFLQEQDPAVRYFKHPKADGSYKELVRDGSLLDPKIPDFDEIDQIFTAMLKAGAITGKEYLVTNFEHHYLEKLRIWFGQDYYIYCQVAVGSALNINADVSNLNMVQRRTFAQKCHNMSFDFMLVQKRTDRIICAIELDDPTHNRVERKLRDRRLDRVCAAAGIPLFHITNINQKPDVERILKRKR